jgi:glutathione synthase/RimK-type ligase-like ATP-grasp enzyme
VKNVALVTAAEARALDEDLPPLLRALREIGLGAEAVVWDDPDVAWDAYALAVVRSTWDYVPRREAFLAWADARSRLANSAAVLRWNTDKRYLRELAAGGAPVAPTSWIEPRDPVLLPSDRPFVVKPAVSAGSKDTARYAPGDAKAVDHVRGLQAAGRSVMVQPYLDGIDAHGETGMIFIAGRYSHAIRKGAILRPDVQYVGGLFAKEDIGRREPSAAERAVADHVLSLVPGDLLYARVDVAPGPAGTPVLLELELTEPSLFFAQSDGAERLLARAIEVLIK